MIGLKRFIRHGLVISVIGHGGALGLGLLAVGANPDKSVPPDAFVLVDIVPPKEAPRFEGTPSNVRSSGSAASFKSNGASAAAQPPLTKPSAHSQQQPQQPANAQHNNRQAMAQPHTMQPETAAADTAQPETAAADTAQPETAQMQTSEPTPAPSQPHPEEVADQPGTSEMFARLALLGGRLGGGFAAPAIDAAQAGYDFTAPFRERVSSCSALPPGIDADDGTRVAVRVSFNPDGTLARPPQLIEPIASWKQQALLQSATEALQKCQPYTMLPADKYKQWKKLNLVISPLNFLGR